jgi:hypothetical protein
MKRSMLATASLLVIAQCAHADPLKTKTVDLDWACHHVQDLNLGGWHAKRSLICGCLEKGYITYTGGLIQLDRARGYPRADLSRDCLFLGD